MSPTFTVVREYDAPLPLVHVDVYRLDHLQELIDESKARSRILGCC